MVLRRGNSWETTTRSGMVSVGDYRLFISTSGPARVAGEPVVIYITGGGSPVAVHVRLQRVLSEVARVYFYDRAGYDLSERAPGREITTARNTALELETLLTKGIRVPPPYILVSHSYGGIIARTFLELHSSDDAIAGMVLAETGTELSYQVFSHIPDPALDKIGEGIDFADLTHLREEAGLSDREWERAREGAERTVPGAEAEDNHGSARQLAKLHQYPRQVLGSRPLSVIRCNMAKDFQLIYDAGVRKGNGTEEERRQAREFINVVELYDEEIRTSQLRLSSVHRNVHIPDCGHDVVIRQPELIAEEVRWVLNALKG